MNKYDKEIASAIIKILNNDTENMYLYQGELSEVKERIKAYHRFCRKICKVADMDYSYSQRRIDNDLKLMIANGLYDDGPYDG